MSSGRTTTPAGVVAVIASSSARATSLPGVRVAPGAMEELRASDDDVARWWDDHAVRDYASVTKRVEHPAAGLMSFNIEIVCTPHEPDQRLIVYTAEPDSATAHVLPILAGWNAVVRP
ncbi:hypothetical protein [Streptomyces sp. NBC_00154]|uniref:MmyB family transcriptional regulator n=1 Tax=Streptomyces sp. NBC_00154 TaxID=2975670 RepID=UPI00224D8FEB|nr:hypothetical protein [Streptomyces sp. NBC_00154]MCX5315461.1 hypothetical protein [Streptomyces sp. NBC_00154]